MAFHFMPEAMHFALKPNLKPDFNIGVNPLFLIIDDDPGTCLIGQINVKKAFRGAEVQTFLEPTKGLDFVYNLSNIEDYHEVIILFLDINMPNMTGFDILDRMTNFKWLSEKLSTYVLSSSVDPMDVEHTLSYEITSGFICKPLTIERLSEVFTTRA